MIRNESQTRAHKLLLNSFMQSKLREISHKRDQLGYVGTTTALIKVIDFDLIERNQVILRESFLYFNGNPTYARESYKQGIKWKAPRE